MIPILYEATELNFTSNGVCRLAEATECHVTEERNGEYELTLTYPITGKYYNQIQEGMYIAATHDDKSDRQPFRIYRRSAPFNGLVQFFAHHISYMLNNIILNPITAGSAADAFDQMETDTITTNPFTMWTDVTTAGNFKNETPSSIRSALGGKRGSILDVYGGEYEWDMFTVKLHAQRGNNSGVTIRYGKNLTDLDQTIDAGGIYNAIVPFWFGTVDDVDVLVTLPEHYVAASGVTSPVMVVMDFSSEFQDQPTEAQLRSAASSFLSNNQPWIPSENIKISFVQLWQTEEYKDVAVLQRLSLCDRVNVYYPAMGITAENVEIIKVVYNVLLDRYDSMELGDARSTFADTLIDPMETAIEAATQNLASKSYMQSAIENSTQQIVGGMGGNIVIALDANGWPVELLMMDTKDKSTAVNVWRWNLGGFGHSHDGYDGPFSDFAITQDGKINANFITAGTMLANRIKGGTLSLGGVDNGNGVLHVYDASGNLIGKWDKDGADISGVLTLLGDDILYTVGEKKQVVFYYSSGEPHYKNALEEAMRFEGYDSSNNLMATRNWGYASDSNIFDMTIIPTNTSPVGPQANRIIFFYKGASNINNISFNDMVESANSRSSHLMLREETSYNSSTNVVEFRMLDTGTEIFKITKAEAQIGSINAYNDGSSSYGSYMRTTTTDNLIKLYSGQASNSFSQLIIGNKHGTNNFKQIRLELAAGPKIRIDADSQIFITDSSTGGTDTDNSDYMDVHNGYIRIRSRYTSGGTSLYTQIDLSPGQSYQKASTSSIRYKHNIEPLHDDILDPHRLYNLKPKQFRYNLEVPLQYPDMYGNTLPGFIAEDVADVYPAAVIHHPAHSGDIESWDERRIIPPMLSLIQEQHEQIEALTERVNQLETLVNQLLNERT